MLTVKEAADTAVRTWFIWGHNIMSYNKYIFGHSYDQKYISQVYLVFSHSS